jgi:LysM repeat protein
MKHLRILVVLGILLLTLGAVPASASSTPTALVPTAQAPVIMAPIVSAAFTSCGPVYTARWGDTLGIIANRCGITILALLHANPGIINPNRIFAGQRLNIPSGTLPPPAPGSATYVVKRGDTLADIAYLFHTTVGALLQANPVIGDRDHIYAGQVIKLPGTPQPPPPPPAPPSFTSVQIPLIARNTNGPVGCGDTVVKVTRNVAATTAPLRAAIDELLSINAQFYGQTGLYNPLYNATLAVQSVAINNGLATIRLTGTLNLGGVCDDPRVAAQFDALGRQFSTVQKVQVFVNGTPLENLLSGKGD